MSLENALHSTDIATNERVRAGFQSTCGNSQQSGIPRGYLAKDGNYLNYPRRPCARYTQSKRELTASRGYRHEKRARRSGDFSEWNYFNLCECRFGVTVSWDVRIYWFCHSCTYIFNVKKWWFLTYIYQDAQREINCWRINASRRVVAILIDILFAVNAIRLERTVHFIKKARVIVIRENSEYWNDRI